MHDNMAHRPATTPFAIRSVEELRVRVREGAFPDLAHLLSLVQTSRLIRAVIHGLRDIGGFWLINS